MSLFNVISEYINKFFLIKHTDRITSELKLLEVAELALNNKINEVIDSVILTPEEFISDYKKSTGDIYRWIQSNSLYAFDPTIEKIALKIREEKRPSKLRNLESSFIKLSQQFLKGLIQLEEEIGNTNQKLEPYYAGLERFEQELEEVKLHYISRSVCLRLERKYEFYQKFFAKSPNANGQISNFMKIYSSLDEYVRLWNEDFVAREMIELKSYFSNIDGKSLDDQQRRAIIVDEDANLIVAGAGSGKTLTISGKVKYLVEKKGIKPEEILLVSFTKKAADEMEERIKKRLKIAVDVNTFHKIGINLVAKQAKNKPDVTDDPRSIIKSYFDQEMYDDPRQLKRMIEFFGYYLNIPKDLAQFENLGEAYEHQKHLDLVTLKSKYEEQIFLEKNREELKNKQTTIKGEKVKSIEEVMLANFLFLNGIEYIYEADYKYETASKYYRQYKPDFYLPEYDLYIEHFGITKDGRVPWLSPIEAQRYIEGIQWKRSLHKKNDTKLIETYSYLTSKGTLLEVLRMKLRENGVRFKEVDFIDIFNKIYDTANTNHFDEFIKFVSTFINLFKSNGYKEDQFEILMNSIDKKNIFFFNRSSIFLEIIQPVYRFYENELKRKKQIDFNDMINYGTDIVRSGQVYFPYKYIIIDEYQDISVSRYKLVQEIRNLTKAKVMCVGDDWQSIFRFAGSDLNLFTEFSKYFGYSELMKIEKTYRNSQELINVAGEFVMKNRKQLVKNLKSDKKNPTPIRLFGYIGLDEILRTFKYTVDEIVKEYGERAEIMILGRNNGDIKFIEKDPDFKIVYKKEGISVSYTRYPEINMFFLTAHRSKGLEADNVIIVNASSKLTGFPNQMSDDPILSMVLTAQDKFLYAEERRLFYVALTRTRNVTYILVPDINMSSFVKELKDVQKNDYEIIEGNTSLSDHPKCPRCIEGYLKVRENSSTKEEFVSCSHYPQCDYTLRDVTVIENPVKCAKCKGYMVRRKGPRGEFYGCSNYPLCRNTMESKKESRLSFE